MRYLITVLLLIVGLSVQAYSPWTYDSEGNKIWKGWVDLYGVDHHPVNYWLQWVVEQDFYKKAPDHVQAVLTDSTKIRLMYDLSRKYHFNPEVMWAQTIQETGWWRHTPNNMYFGIKTPKRRRTDGQLKWTWEWYPDKGWKYEQHYFEEFDGAKESFEQYAELISRPMYNTEGMGYIKAIQKIAKHYATGPNYASNVINNIEYYHLYRLNDLWLEN